MAQYGELIDLGSIKGRSMLIMNTHISNPTRHYPDLS